MILNLYLAIFGFFEMLMPGPIDQLYDFVSMVVNTAFDLDLHDLLFPEFGRIVLFDNIA